MWMLDGALGVRGVMGGRGRGPVGQTSAVLLRMGRGVARVEGVRLA